MWFLIFLVSMVETVEAKNSKQLLTKNGCLQLIINHKADESVTYKSGVDVTGKPLVPADLQGNKTYGLGDQVTTPLKVPLQKFAPKFPTTGNTYVQSTVKDSDIHTGFIQVDKDGTVKINGEKVEDEEQERIRDFCTKTYPDLN